MSTVRTSPQYRKGNFCKFCGRDEKETKIVLGVCRDCQEEWEAAHPEEERNFDGLRREYKRRY